ncbi:NAD-dependent epimerase/dehydratase family protein [Ramlibacter rhizophilus]|uniref:NAD(P)-dependent oxidoreductase n=1 Tax=Ramlibacter rhizophilus TaxID=1781167 RepID=A0A4Z0BNJ7_9BURK|nr:NAD(P)-dependent oxidoreductase [Ramlibacter rhizophilus]TFY99999.1 NAD(P)-dependent oxidoreductase [Ramlibacter rhizophilus]
MNRVLVLGGTGYIGARLVARLAAAGMQPLAASSRGGPGVLRLDTRDETALSQALGQCDAVVNCVAGSGPAIALGAQVLARALAASECRRLVHFSTMSVYGAQEGLLDEQATLNAGLGWYGRAKIDAEAQFARLPEASVTVLRPGCVFGPGSELWVGRIARWLEAGRLGDLGPGGDGWSNLVHVDDVCQAAVLALQAPPHPDQLRTYNLAAPDSPRWNDYFADLALAIGATPLRRVRSRQLQLDAFVAGPPLHIGRKLLARVRRDAQLLPPPITPGLLGLWQRHLRLDARAATRELALPWTPYAKAVQQCARWWIDRTQEQARPWNPPAQARAARPDGNA